MKNKAFILSGSLFGDEGKGTFIDYLALEKGINRNVRYNGGSQASHSVTLENGIVHKFSQLGSTMFMNNNKTFLSENTVVNLFNLVAEAKWFSKRTSIPFEKILDNVSISKDAVITTPYHMLTNQIRELSIKNKRGSVGTGVSEVVNVFNDTGIYLHASDFLDGKYIDILDDLYIYTKNFYKENIDKIADDELQYIEKDDITHLTDNNYRHFVRSCYKEMLSSLRFNIINGISQFSNGKEDIIFEGSQGLLIDSIYGIKPNTTLLDTTNHYGVKLANDLGLNITKIGVIKAFSSRHGLGILPTFDEHLTDVIDDYNQQSTFFQGSDPIYGWFDSVLLRYSQRINKNDEYFLSCLDVLEQFDTLKICDHYQYNGIIDSEFIKTFEYHISSGKIFITNIINNSPRLKEFLLKCIPIYIEIDGFKNSQDYSNYINLIEELTEIKISLLSNGEKRNNKIRRLSL